MEGQAWKTIVINSFNKKHRHRAAYLLHEFGAWVPCDVQIRSLHEESVEIRLQHPTMSNADIRVTVPSYYVLIRHPWLSRPIPLLCFEQLNSLIKEAREHRVIGKRF